MFLSVLILLCCQDSAPEPSTEPNKKTPQQPHRPFKNLDEGQKHPPIPADNPMWEWDAQNFVPDFGWFGEHSWADVRMRVAGHLSAAGRDLARVKASQEEWMPASLSYKKLHKQLKAIQQQQKEPQKRSPPPSQRLTEMHKSSRRLLKTNSYPYQREPSLHYGLDILTLRTATSKGKKPRKSFMPSKKSSKNSEKRPRA